MRLLFVAILICGASILSPLAGLGDYAFAQDCPGCEPPDPEPNLGTSDGGRERDTREFRNVGEAPIFGITRNAVEATLVARQRFEGNLEKCNESDPLETFHRCIATAMAIFANDLEKPEVALPEETQPVPEIIRTAARKVLNAPDRETARAAVAEALVEVKKTIELIKADEPVYATLADMQTRQGNIIAEGLQVAEAKLERAVGI
jgi:hypothetical protein